MMDWDDFRYLQAVAQTGSVRGAGELLQVHGSTVTRRLDQLEQRIGAKLFARTPHGMEMTAAAAGVMDCLDHVAAELARVERSLQSDGPAPSGAVGLAMPRMLAAKLVIPNLGVLYRRHPDLEVALSAEAPMQQLRNGAVDIAVCVTDEPAQDLIGRPLGPVMACPYGASGRPHIEPPRWVGPDHPGSLAATVRARYFPTLRQGLRLDDPDLLVETLLAGFGVGVLPCFVGDATPGLARVDEAVPLREGELWLFTRPESRGVARIQALSAFLQETFVSHRPALEGRPAGSIR
jgi:DNA-binding transcriptional LysR family regulator